MEEMLAKNNPRKMPNEKKRENCKVCHQHIFPGCSRTEHKKWCPGPCKEGKDCWLREADNPLYRKRHNPEWQVESKERRSKKRKAPTAAKKLTQK